jgi:hypothetical protein
VLSLLALKLVGMRRVSHVDDLAADTGAGLFASLVALPKATALSTYSYRLSHARQVAFLGALGKAMLEADLLADRGGDLDLDFHAIMHWGEDMALERHYVPSRSQRTRSVLSFFAQDHSTHNLVYANADLTTDRQAQEVLVFSDHCKALTGRFPELLVMDQKVTTHKVLAELDARGIGFITLRMRSPSLLRHIQALPASAWRTVRLDRGGAYRSPKVVDEQVTVTDYPQTIRQLVVRGLGREAPTVIMTNNRRASAKMVIERYAGRMTSNSASPSRSAASTSTRSPPLCRSMSTWTSCSRCSPARSVPRSAAGSPATRQRPPTPSSAGSCPPAASSSTGETPSSSA